MILRQLSYSLFGDVIKQVVVRSIMEHKIGVNSNESAEKGQENVAESAEKGQENSGESTEEVPKIVVLAGGMLGFKSGSFEDIFTPKEGGNIPEIVTIISRVVMQGLAYIGGKILSLFQWLKDKLFGAVTEVESMSTITLKEDGTPGEKIVNKVERVTNGAANWLSKTWQEKPHVVILTVGGIIAGLCLLPFVISVLKAYTVTFAIASVLPTIITAVLAFV